MILIVLLPVGLLTWFGLRMARDEQSVTRQRFRSVMEQRLEDVNRVVASRFDETERRLHQITSVDNFDLTELRRIVRTEPQVTQLFVLSPDGSLQYPNPGDALNGTELSFLQRASRMFTDRDLQNAVAQTEAGVQGDFSPVGVSENENATELELQANSSDEQAAMQDPAPAFAAIEDSMRSFSQLAAPNQDVAAAGQGDVVTLDDMKTTTPQPSEKPLIDESEAESAVSRFPAPAATRAAKETLETNQPAPAMRSSQPALKMEVREQPAPFLPSNGWFVWYWDRGLNLIYWQRRPSGHIVGAALERARWIADLIAWLPETDRSNASPSVDRVQTSFRVISSSAEIVYEWGHDHARDEMPFCEVPLSPPLASWRLQCFVPADQVASGSGRSAFLGFAAGLGGFALTLTAMAWLLYRDYSRDMREASQQVSFVNQVSHELKTPLTNIRLYADLLERDLGQVSEEQSEKPLRRLEVITSEAQRLSRLIGNVLTFARQKRNSLQLHPALVHVGDVVRQIADRFSPSLTDHGIETDLFCEECSSLWLDPDFVEQILGNLISNVEKYAASGKKLMIRTAIKEDKAIIDVIDQGPGIEAAHRLSLFVPFSRLSKDLRASTGTGIGLSIVRELARLHGGDVILKESTAGCWFQVQLKSQQPPEASAAQ